MTGGDGVYQALRALGVDTVFGIVSIHNTPIFDAIARGGEIEIITVRHEQSAVHSADGYARATGQLGVTVASTGPGTTNTMTGLYEAAFASSRVLLITGQVQTRFIGRHQAMIHEAENQVPMLQSVCRHVESPRTPEDVIPALYRVVQDILTGRPQPGAIEIPIDLQHGDMPETTAEAPAPKAVEPNASDIEKAADLLRSAPKRIVWAGGGVIRAGASKALIDFAEALDAPVVTTVNGRGAIPEDHPLCAGSFLGTPEVREVLGQADVILAVGTRFRWGDTGQYTLQLGGKLIHLDADESVFGRSYEPAVAVVGDAKLGLEQLLTALKDATDRDASFSESAAKATHAAREGNRAGIGPDYEAIMDHMRMRLPRDCVIVRDSTVPAYLWADRLLAVYEPGTAISPTSAAIGPGLPLGVGAAAGTRKPTLVIHGDGGFMLHIGELATAADFNLPVKICVFNDGGYGVLRGIQMGAFEGRTIGVDLQTPDFAAVAKAMGMGAENVSGVEGFKQAFDRAMGTDGPYLLDIDMSSLAGMAGLGAPRAKR